jgi:hydroxylamine reductase
MESQKDQIGEDRGWHFGRRAALRGALLGASGIATAVLIGCGGNDLPLSLIISWYEQKAVAILLTLLHLGLKNIRLGPTLPAFITPNVLNVLVEKFNIQPIKTVEEDLKAILG